MRRTLCVWLWEYGNVVLLCLFPLVPLLWHLRFATEEFDWWLLLIELPAIALATLVGWIHYRYPRRADLSERSKRKE